VTSDVELASLFPWMALHSAPPPPPPPPPPPAVDESHEDDALCVCCLDAPRDTPLVGCGGAHPPCVCADCAALLKTAAAPACPLCRAPLVCV
jgi:hypothetical protein